MTSGPFGLSDYRSGLRPHHDQSSRKDCSLPFSERVRAAIVAGSALSCPLAAMSDDRALRCSPTSRLDYEVMLAFSIESHLGVAHK